MKHPLNQSVAAVAASLLALFGAASHSQALTLDNIEHFSDAGGVWNNTTPQNWAIWASTNSDPNSDAPRPFLNEPDPLNNPITMPTNGTFTWTLYKNNYGNDDVRTVFHFSDAGNTGMISIEPNTPYLSTTDPVPATPGQSVTLGDMTVSITSFGWYDETVFNKDFVSTQQTLGPGGGADHIAVATFQVVPEPASAAIVLMSGVGMFGMLRRRRA